MSDPISAQGKSPKGQTALGKGLRMLIAPAELSHGEIRHIQIDRIIPNRYQPRKEVRPETLRSLADSLRSHGLIQPIAVREEQNGRFELVAGERRWRAAQLAGFTEIPALVKELNEQEVMEWALLENLQREDLNPIEKAHAYSRLLTEFTLTQEAIAARIGVDRTTVANLLRLLTLPAVIQKAVSEGTISTGHAKVLLSLDGEEDQLRFAEKIHLNGWTVRQTEENARSSTQFSVSQSIQSEDLSHKMRKIQSALLEVFGVPVRVKRKGKCFQIRIKYRSPADLKLIAGKFFRPM